MICRRRASPIAGHDCRALMSTGNSTARWCLLTSFAAACSPCSAAHAPSTRISTSTWMKPKPGDFWVNPPVNFVRLYYCFRVRNVKTWTYVNRIFAVYNVTVSVNNECIIAVASLMRCINAEKGVFGAFYFRQGRYVLSAVCLFVCLLATSHHNCWSDHRENFARDVSFDKEATVKFCKSFGSGSRCRSVLKEFLPLWDRGTLLSEYFADNSRSCQQILMKFFDGWDVSLATNRFWCWSGLRKF